MARQELDLRVAFEEMEKDDRLQRVSYLREKFVVARAESEMILGGNDELPRDYHDGRDQGRGGHGVRGLG